MRFNPADLASWLARQTGAGTQSLTGLGTGVVGMAGMTVAGGIGFTQRELEALSGGVFTLNRAVQTAIQTLDTFNSTLLRLADILSQRVNAGFNIFMSILRFLRVEGDIFTNLLMSMSDTLSSLVNYLQAGLGSLSLFGNVVAGVGRAISAVTGIISDLIVTVSSAFRAFSDFARGLTTNLGNIVGVVASVSAMLGGLLLLVTRFGWGLTGFLGRGLPTMFGFLGRTFVPFGAGAVATGLIGGGMAGLAGIALTASTMLTVMSTVLLGAGAIVAVLARSLVPMLTPVLFPALLYFLARLGLSKFIPALGTPTMAGMLTLGAGGALLLAPVIQAFGQLIPIVGRFVQAIGSSLEAFGTLLQRIAEGLGRLLELTLRVMYGFIQGGLMLWRTFGSVAAQAQTVSIALQVMAGNAGVARERIMGLWLALTRQNIALLEGGQSMIMLMARFYPLVGLTERLAEVAKDWAAAMGFVSSEVLRDFSVAVTRGEISMLEHLNIVYASSLAWELFAQQIGKSAQDLNAFERSLAVADFLINRIGRSVRGVYEETFNSLGKLLSSFQRVIQTVQILAGRELLYPFTMLGKGIYSFLDALSKTVTEGARYGQGLRFLFAAIAEGFTQGLEIVFRAPRQQFFEKKPEANPIARTILETLNSPQFRQAALQLGGLVRAMTVWLGNLFLNILQNLPRYLTTVINFFRQFVAVLIYVWTWLRAIGAMLSQVLGQLTGQWLQQFNLAGQGAIGFLNMLSMALATLLKNLGAGFQWLMTFVGNLLIGIGKGFLALSQYLLQNQSTISSFIATVILNLQALGAHMRNWFATAAEYFSELLMWLVQLSWGFRTVITVATFFYTLLQTKNIAAAVAATVAVMGLGLWWWKTVEQPMNEAAIKMKQWATQQKAIYQTEMAEIFDPQKNPVANWAHNQLPQHLNAAQQKFQQWGNSLMGVGQNLKQFGQSVNNTLNQAASGIVTATQQAKQAATQFLSNTQSLSSEAVNAMTQLNENLMNATQRFRAMREIVREVARGAELLSDATKRLIDYYNTLYGTVSDIGALGFARILYAWRQVEVAFINISMMMAALQDRSINVRDVFGTLEELAQELYGALAEWAKAVVDAFEGVRNLVRGLSDAVRVAGDMTENFTFGTMAALQLLSIRRATLSTELQILATELRLPLGVETRIRLTRELFETQQALLQVTREELELINKVTDAWAKSLKETGNAIKELAERFAVPVGYLITNMLNLQAIAAEMRATTLTVLRGLFVGDIPYQMLTEAIGRLNALRAQFITTLYDLINQPLRGVTQILDAQADYWKRARDLVNSFNLGLFATIEIHLSEAAVLAEKLRILELMAMINRHNFEAYWRIRAEIVAIKKELLDIARRPVFIFGLTREQVERSFTDFQRLMGDPRFWRRWRLGEIQLTEMAFRASIWAQQMGLVAMQVFDPRFINLLSRMGLTPAGLPIMRWQELISQLTGRPMPYPFQHLLIAMQETLLQGLTDFPRPFGGLPTPAYLMQFLPQVAQIAGAYGTLPLSLFGLPPSPFLPRPIPSLGFFEPLMAQFAGIGDTINFLAQIASAGERLYYLMSNMATLHQFYLPRISDTLAAYLQQTAQLTFAFMTTMLGRPIESPEAYVTARRRFEQALMGQRLGYAPTIVAPTDTGVPRLMGGVSVPVTMGNLQIGTLTLDENFMRALINSVVMNIIRGYALP